jgi:methanogenic corrinoid protein MtbC1
MEAKPEHDVPQVWSSADVPGKQRAHRHRGDIHDIGENIVIPMLDVNGYKVLDLGIEVLPE